MAEEQEESKDVIIINPAEELLKALEIVRGPEVASEWRKVVRAAQEKAEAESMSRWTRWDEI